VAAGVHGHPPIGHLIELITVLADPTPMIDAWTGEFQPAAVVALVLVGASIGALVRAIRSRRGIVLTSVGLAAILAAGIAGSSFVGNQSNGASFGMALATAVAMFCYLAAVFSLR
jgi:hypothetical protein